MSRTSRNAAALVVGVVLTLAACGDDGNDRGLEAERAALLAAELRASATAPPAPEPTAAPARDDERQDESMAEAPSATSAPVTTAPPVEPTGVVVPVVALDNSFRPEVVTIDVGDEVLWENRGINDHNALYVDGDDWGVEVEDFGPGAVYAHVFTEPGEYRYFCSIHGNEDIGMIGTIIVEG